MSIPLLQSRLQELPQVDEAIVDMEWVQRLAAFIVLAERAVWVLARCLSWLCYWW